MGQLESNKKLVTVELNLHELKGKVNGHRSSACARLSGSILRYSLSYFVVTVFSFATSVLSFVSRCVLKVLKLFLSLR
jgi:hypothetical protein